MTNKEFESIYGRPPVQKKIVRRKKIYWNRVIIAFLILTGIIWGMAQLCSNIFGKKTTEDKISQPKGEKLVNSTNEKEADEKNDKKNHFIVCLDPGHGGSDVGTPVNNNTRFEKDDSLSISMIVKKYLEQQGVTVVMTRTDDSDVSLGERCSIANEAEADFFVSLHRNSYNGDIGGVEVWVNNSEPEEDTTLATNILKDLESVGIAENRGVQYGYIGNEGANYYINADTVMPSCLVELGFITSEKDNKLFDEKKNEYAKAVADGIIETAVHLGVVDENGERLIDNRLISPQKYINNVGSNSGENSANSSGNDDAEYASGM